MSITSEQAQAMLRRIEADTILSDSEKNDIITEILNGEVTEATKLKLREVFLRQRAEKVQELQSVNDRLQQLEQQYAKVAANAEAKQKEIDRAFVKDCDQIVADLEVKLDAIDEKMEAKAEQYLENADTSEADTIRAKLNNPPQTEE